MRPRRVAGTQALHQRIRDLQDEAEWQRQRTVIAALLPYSGDNVRPRAGTAVDRTPIAASRRDLTVLIPKQRQPLPSEPRLVDEARRAQYPHLRKDIDNNRGGRA